MISRLIDKLRDRRRLHVAIRDLERLSDRELLDIGLVRQNIRQAVAVALNR